MSNIDLFAGAEQAILSGDLDRGIPMLDEYLCEDHLDPLRRMAGFYNLGIAIIGKFEFDERELGTCSEKELIWYSAASRCISMVSRVYGESKALLRGEEEATTLLRTAEEAVTKYACLGLSVIDRLMELRPRTSTVLRCLASVEDSRLEPNYRSELVTLGTYPAGTGPLRDASPLERAAKPAIYCGILVSALSLRAAESVLRPGCGEHLRALLCFFHEKAGSCQLKLLGLCF